MKKRFFSCLNLSILLSIPNKLILTLLLQKGDHFFDQLQGILYHPVTEASVALITNGGDSGANGMREAISVSLTVEEVIVRHISLTIHGK